MKRPTTYSKLLFILIAIALSGCVTTAIPEGYMGPVAYVTDTVIPHSGSKADMFYLSEVNGRRIQNSLYETRTANYGQGFHMDPVTTAREVPAQPSTYKIVGRTHYAAPILSLASTVYEISGEIYFSPIPRQSYIVKGVLSETYCAVWIENELTGDIVGKKIEMNGSSKLGFFEK